MRPDGPQHLWSFGDKRSCSVAFPALKADEMGNIQYPGQMRMKQMTLDGVSGCEPGVVENKVTAGVFFFLGGGVGQQLFPTC